MTILDDFLQYKDANGFIQPGIGQGSLNGLLYTAISIIVLRDNGIVVPYDMFKIIRDCQVVPGLFSRTPERVGGKEGPDDYIGLSAIQGFFSPAWEIYLYGKANNWIYNWENPGKFTFSSWLGRMPQVIAHIKYGGQRYVNPLHRFYWALSIVWAARSKASDVDAFMLSWLLIRNFEKSGQKSWLSGQAIKYWDKKTSQLFGPAQLANMPYLNGNLEHPITKNWRR